MNPRLLTTDAIAMGNELGDHLIKEHMNWLKQSGYDQNLAASVAVTVVALEKVTRIHMQVVAGLDRDLAKNYLKQLHDTLSKSL